MGSGLDVGGPLIVNEPVAAATARITADARGRVVAAPFGIAAGSECLR